jgi:hypothetical protein
MSIFCQEVGMTWCNLIPTSPEIDRPGQGALHKLLLLFAIASFGILAGPSSAVAQRCSGCTSCEEPCTASDYGGNSCSFSSGCCEETGGNCNPQLSTLVEQGVAPDDLVTTESSQFGLVTVATLARVSPSVLAAWDCTGQVRALYWNEETIGSEPPGMAINSHRYTLAAYLVPRQRSLNAPAGGS